MPKPRVITPKRKSFIKKSPSHEAVGKPFLKIASGTNHSSLTSVGSSSEINLEETMKKSLLFTVAALCLAAAPTLAQPWSRYDYNGNGRLDYHERLSMEQNRHLNWNGSEWNRFDLDRDGRIDSWEWRRLQGTWNSGNRNSWLRFDRNHDGRIDGNERSYWLNHWNHWSQLQWRAYDRNGDGRLSRGERKQWERALRRR
jgi:hypothetical protein